MKCDAAHVYLIYMQSAGAFSSVIGSSSSKYRCSSQIAGIWHTSVVVGGFEYFYGGGVQKALAGSTPYGHPVEIVDLG